MLVFVFTPFLSFGDGRIACAHSWTIMTPLCVCIELFTCIKLFTCIELFTCIKLFTFINPTSLLYH